MLRLLPVVAVFAALGFRMQAAPIISPDGSAYSSYTASSELNPNYTVDNLFDQNPTVGQEISLSGSDAGFAYGGAVDLSPLYVEFQLDNIYTVQSLFYAQRDFNNNHDATHDKIGTIDLWASKTTAFSASDPGFAPNATVSITNLSDDKYLEYLLSAPVDGKFFLIRLTAVPNQGGSVFGGTEFRLGGVVPEPSTALLLVFAAVAGLGFRRLRKSRVR